MNMLSIEYAKVAEAAKQSVEVADALMKLFPELAKAKKAFPFTAASLNIALPPGGPLSVVANGTMVVNKGWTVKVLRKASDGSMAFQFFNDGEGNIEVVEVAPQDKGVPPAVETKKPEPKPKEEVKKENASPAPVVAADTVVSGPADDLPF